MRGAMRTILTILAFGLVAGAAHAAKAQGNAANGRALFMANLCYSCHGTTGAGGGAAGPRIAPPPALPRFVAQLRHPDRMPPYTEKVLTDAQVADIRAWLAGLPAGKPAAEIPILAR